MTSTNEKQRLEKLASFNVLDTMPEREFDDIVKIASTICATPIALVSLVDEKRQWFKACVGVGVQQMGREVAFCDHTIRNRENFIVEDASRDERFMFNPLVIDEPFVRFYAGVPLWTSDGHCLGSLCVVDLVPRTLTTSQIESLEALARQVMALLEMRTANAEAQLDRLQAKNAQERLRESTHSLSAGIYHLDKEGRCTFVNEGWCQVMGLTREQSLGYGYMSNVVEEDRLVLFEKSLEARKQGASFKGAWRVRHSSGSIRHIEAQSVADAIGGRVGTVYDVTDYVHRIQELEKELSMKSAPVLKKAE